MTAWVRGAAQADYETLRAAVLAGTPLIGTAARRFAAGGLAALIRRPAAAPLLTATFSGAARPAWCGNDDPRVQALAAGYALLLAVPIIGCDQPQQIELQA